MKPPFEPHQWMHDLKEALDQSELTQKLDSSIESMLTHDEFTRSNPRSGKAFDQVVQDYISILYQKLELPLTRYEALTRGQELLNRFYDPGNASGYDLAMVDVVQEETIPMEQILRILSDGIKQIQSASLQDHVIKFHTQSLTWIERCRLVEWMKQDLEISHIDTAEPEEGVSQMVAYLDQWIASYLETSFQ